LFTNDKHPSVYGESKRLETYVEDDVSIGAGAIILPGVRIGKGAKVAAGALVSKDVKAGMHVVGLPARVTYHPVMQ